MKKTYKCCICHKILKDTKPIRLVEQHYGIGNYNQFSHLKNHDFCKGCFNIFRRWIYRHKENEK